MATDPSCLRAIQVVATLLAERGIPYAVIGGTAIQLIYGVASTRPTADVDAVILVRDLDEFLQVQADLERRGWTHAQEPYRMLAPEGCRVDLLPYAGANVVDEQLVFPGSRETLTTTGWPETIAAARRIDVPGIGPLPLPPPEYLVGLKAVAWYARGSITTKDAYDIVTLVRQFGRFDDITELLAAGTAESEGEARAILMSRAVNASMPAAAQKLKSLASALTDEKRGLPTWIWGEWERQLSDRESTELEIKAIGQGLLKGLGTA